MFRENDNGGRRVGGDHAGDDGSIDNKKVVGSIDLCVEVHDRGATSASIVRADLGGSC